MLKQLRIRNFALIDHLDIDFEKGLTILTGETGAGKSIILGALGLVLGERADLKSLNDPEKKCIVEADFDISNYNLNSFFEEQDLDFSKEITIRRELQSSGKSRALINDSVVSLPILNKLSSSLVHLHLQFDTSTIGNPLHQLTMLDSLTGIDKNLLDYKIKYKNYILSVKELSRLKELQSNSLEQNEFLKFQLEELEKIEIKEGEEQVLKNRLVKLRNASEIIRSTSEASKTLKDLEYNPIEQLRSIGINLNNRLKSFDEIKSIIERIDQCINELEDIASSLENISESVQIDQELLNETELRLDLINGILVKHRCIDSLALLEKIKSLQDQYSSVSDIGATIATLEKSVGQSRRELLSTAELFSSKRRQTAQEMSEKIVELLRQMQMKEAKMVIDFQTLDEPGPSGIDEVNFLFSANSGRAVQPIKQVASGGELSRLSLCIESLVASSIPLPTLIFDEIDSGVSGEVSMRMGEILRNMAQGHQVVVITHSPQVSAGADHHWHVKKNQNNDNTNTEIKKLNEEEKILNIAIMLSGDPPNPGAIQNAKELIHKAKNVL